MLRSLFNEIYLKAGQRNILSSFFNWSTSSRSIKRIWKSWVIGLKMVGLMSLKHLLLTCVMSKPGGKVRIEMTQSLNTTF